jgi:hypothetical protein
MKGNLTMGEEIPLPKEDPRDGLIKRTYEPPVLRSYGTLRDITLHVGKEGHPDGGKKPHNRTHM